MNRKGFTLIELLAVLVVLGIVLVISIPSITDAYKNSKIKSEEAFTQRLTQTIDSYVKLNSDEFIFESAGTAYKKEDEKEDDSKYQVNIWKASITVKNIKSEITVQNVIDDNLISEGDYVNPGNKDYINPVTNRKSCNTTAEIEVYKDSDFVYCYKVEKDSLGCLTDEYKNKITDNYVINTCVWTEKTE